MSSGSQQSFSPHERSCEIGGNRIVYWEKGIGDALFLIHGMFGDYLDWETVLEPLARTHRVIALDLPGFGQSDKPVCDYSAGFYVDTLHAFFKQLAIERPTIVGNSFGGEVAILYAIAHPENVSAMVLVSSGGLRLYSEEEKRVLSEKFSAANLRAITPEINEWMFAGVFSRESEERRRYLEKQNAKLQRADYPAYTEILHRCMVLAFSLYFEDELRSIRCPVLLLWGDQDQVFPLSHAERALALLPNAKLALLPGAGHAPQLEAAEAFVTELESFLRK